LAISGWWLLEAKAAAVPEQLTWQFTQRSMKCGGFSVDTPSSFQARAISSMRRTFTIPRTVSYDAAESCGRPLPTARRIRTTNLPANKGQQAVNLMTKLSA